MFNHVFGGKCHRTIGNGAALGGARFVGVHINDLRHLGIDRNRKAQPRAGLEFLCRCERTNHFDLPGGEQVHLVFDSHAIDRTLEGSSIDSRIDRERRDTREGAAMIRYAQPLAIRGGDGSREMLCFHRHHALGHVADAGTYEIQVGGSSEDIRQKMKLRVR